MNVADVREWNHAGCNGTGTPSSCPPTRNWAPKVRERRDQSFEVRRLRGGRQVEMVGVQRRTVKPGATPPISTYLTAWPSNALRIRSAAFVTVHGRL
jgi:hypothetical protein